MHWREYIDPEEPDGAFLSWKRVEPRVGISRTTAWRLQRAGDFPTPYVMSPGRVAYRESEVEAWKASRSHRGGAQLADGRGTPVPSPADTIPAPELTTWAAPPKAPRSSAISPPRSPDAPPRLQAKPRGAGPSGRTDRKRRAVRVSSPQLNFDF